jgi:hypothetical protein
MERYREIDRNNDRERKGVEIPILANFQTSIYYHLKFLRRESLLSLKLDPKDFFRKSIFFLCFLI